MSMVEKAKRYLVFLFGLFISSLGVSMITKADLGTSPISAIPYVLSLNFPWTLGGFTVVFSLVLILLQLIILRKNFMRRESEPIVLITEDTDGLRVKRLFIQISMSFWTTPT